MFDHSPFANANISAKSKEEIMKYVNENRIRLIKQDLLSGSKMKGSTGKNYIEDFDFGNFHEMKL